MWPEFGYLTQALDKLGAVSIAILAVNVKIENMSKLMKQAIRRAAPYKRPSRYRPVKLGSSPAACSVRPCQPRNWTLESRREYAYHLSRFVLG